jgi:hypothetical protein
MSSRHLFMKAFLVCLHAKKPRLAPKSQTGQTNGHPN